MKNTLPLFTVADTYPVSLGKEAIIYSNPLPYCEASDLMIRLNATRSEGEFFEIIESDEA